MKKYIQAFFFSLLLAAAIFFVSTDVKAQGCVMCKAQVGESKDEDHAKNVGGSLNSGILYLMAIPYVLVATLGFVWYRQNRNKESA